MFLCTQIADEARHVRFFNRFYEEVGVLEADSLQGRLAETSEHVNPEFNELFDEMLKSRVDHLARQPEDLEKLVEAVTLYHMVIEGMLALTGQHFILQYNEEQGTLPGFVEGFNNDRPRRAPPRGLRRPLPARDGPGATPATARPSRARSPRWRRSPTPCSSPSGTWRARRSCSAPTWRRRAPSPTKALERRLKVIGLAPVA